MRLYAPKLGNSHPLYPCAVWHNFFSLEHYIQPCHMSNQNGPNQDNIGYENTEVRTDQDNKENDRTQTTDTDKGEGNKPPADKDKSFDEQNNSGLRADSGEKTS